MLLDYFTNLDFITLKYKILIIIAKIKNINRINYHYFNFLQLVPNSSKFHIMLNTLIAHSSLGLAILHSNRNNPGLVDKLDWRAIHIPVAGRPTDSRYIAIRKRINRRLRKRRD